MRRHLLTIALLLLVAGVAAAADANPPLLCDSDTLKAPTVTASAAGVCAPAPVCPTPAPVCPPAPPVCEAKPAPVCAAPAKTEVCRTVEVPVRRVVNEVKVVPVKKKVYEEECYTVEEKRVQVVDEIRSRVAQRKVKVPTTKVVSDVALEKVQPCEGRSPRLARVVYNKTVPTTVTVTEQYDETYTVPVRTTYSVPVTKTRKVAREVEELKTVNVPVTVTTMETRLLASKR